MSAVVVAVVVKVAREGDGALVSVIWLRGRVPRMRGYESGCTMLVAGRTKSVKTVAECGDFRCRGHVEARSRLALLEEFDVQT